VEQIVVCIPAFNPTRSLILLLEQLTEYPFRRIIIINDGSDIKSKEVFKKAATFENVEILHLKRNSGKGKAVKTALQYIIKNIPSIQGVLTCGADGQHHIEDIIKVATTSRIFVDGIILGMRNFNSEHISVVHRIHSQAMALLFKLLFKKRIVDFQSGLRFFPYHQLPWIKSCQGDSFHFDTNVLIEAIRREVPIYELPIGKVRMSQSSFLQYDEVVNPKILSAQLLQSYLKKTETF
jgi:glycosyltransferase involved in cell wall biosynthesis